MQKHSLATRASCAGADPQPAPADAAAGFVIVVPATQLAPFIYQQRVYMIFHAIYTYTYVWICVCNMK